MKIKVLYHLNCEKAVESSAVQSPHSMLSVHGQVTLGVVCTVVGVVNTSFTE